VLPTHFATRLQAALLRARAAPGLRQARAQLERERDEQLRELQAGYVRVRRRTLVTMIAAAFASGAAAVSVMPWLEVRFGSLGPPLLAAAGALLGLTLGLLAWRAQFDEA
jgi:hypothetical protein